MTGVETVQPRQNLTRKEARALGKYAFWKGHESTDYCDGCGGGACGSCQGCGGGGCGACGGD